MLWDLFCRVIDNHGDAGVCWRLAVELAGRGERVRLWIDQPEALQWMAPCGAQGVTLRDWNAAEAEAPGAAPADVVIEAFGCDLPQAFQAAMAALAVPPLWINLEYLSAEPWAAASHGLRSPQFSGPAAGLDKWFFYPGFDRATGGLLRERDLLARQAAFDRAAWLGARGWRPDEGERLAVLFAYDNPQLPLLLQSLAREPTLLLVCPGQSQRQLAGLVLPAGLRSIALPWLPQPEFDHLLWSADLNLVRGEDSWVRAIWAGRPFLWQAYPQADGAHAAKVAAFVDAFEDAAGDPGNVHHSSQRRALQLAWNGLGPWPQQALHEVPRVLPNTLWPSALLDGQAWLRWRDHLLRQPDLATQLTAFVQRHRAERR